MATDQQKMWFCGFYEGEGSISNDKSNNNRLRLCISQNDPTPLILGQDLWGGSIRERIRKSPASDTICRGHEWRLSHKDSIKFIEDIKPFMVIPYKIDQITTALCKAERGHTDKYKCSFCENVYSNPAGRRRHEKKEHIDKGTIFTCEICDKTYKSRDSLQRHSLLNHNTKMLVK